MHIIDEDSLTFKIEKESTETPYNNDLLKDVRKLAWEEYFLE
jgi:hypothetical protein